jgi:hypothetical protein
MIEQGLKPGAAYFVGTALGVRPGSFSSLGALDRNAPANCCNKNAALTRLCRCVDFVMLVADAKVLLCHLVIQLFPP